MPVLYLPTDIDKDMFRIALKRFKVTEKELHDAFWLAYADPYVPSKGIEFRHLYKHIEKSRLGSGEKLYTYNEMLNVVDKEYIDTDHFDKVETDEGVRWRRK